MLNHYENLVHESRAIVIAKEDTQEGPRIGGNAPEGVRPTRVYESTRYFVTLPLDDYGSQEVSLFTSLDYGDRAESRSIYRNVSSVFELEDFVQIAVHSKSKRSGSKLLASELPGRVLEIKPATPDVVVPSGELLRPNKLGGKPYFYSGTQSYIDDLNRLFNQGFFLFLQLTWGGYERTVPFMWPFDQYSFHLLAKETSGGISLRYGWG